MYGRVRVPKREQLQWYILTVLKMPVLGDSHQNTSHSEMEQTEIQKAGYVYACKGGAKRQSKTLIKQQKDYE